MKDQQSYWKPSFVAYVDLLIRCRLSIFQNIPVLFSSSVILFVEIYRNAERRTSSSCLSVPRQYITKSLSNASLTLAPCCPSLPFTCSHTKQILTCVCLLWRHTTIEICVSLFLFFTSYALSCRYPGYLCIFSLVLLFFFYGFEGMYWSVSNCKLVLQ